MDDIYWDIEKKTALSVMNIKKYYIVVGIKKILLRGKKYTESGFLFVVIVLKKLKKSLWKNISMGELGKVKKNRIFIKSIIKIALI